MCDKGRAANKWGVCGQSSVERKPVPDGLCKAYEERKKKKKKNDK